MRRLRRVLFRTKPMRRKARAIFDRLMPIMVVMSLAASIIFFEVENRHLRNSFCGLVLVVGAPQSQPKVSSSYGEVIYKQANITSRRLGC